MIKTLNCSIFKNLTTLLHGPIILINSNDTKLISKKLKNISAKVKKMPIITTEPIKAMRIADLKIHSARNIFLLPKALAVAPLTAPPKAPLDNILVSI